MSEITFWHNIQQRGTRGNGSNRKEWVWVNQWAPFMGTDQGVTGRRGWLRSWSVIDSDRLKHKLNLRCFFFWELCEFKHHVYDLFGGLWIQKDILKVAPLFPACVAECSYLNINTNSAYFSQQNIKSSCQQHLKKLFLVVFMCCNFVLCVYLVFGVFSFINLFHRVRCIYPHPHPATHSNMLSLLWNTMLFLEEILRYLVPIKCQKCTRRMTNVVKVQL